MPVSKTSRQSARHNRNGDGALGVPQRAVTESTPSPNSPAIAVLDHAGTIVAVNDAWRRVAYENGAAVFGEHGTGRTYQEAWHQALGLSGTQARDASAGIQAVLDGTLPEFQLARPSNAFAKRRWFLLHAMPLLGAAPGAPGGVVVSYVSIADRKLKAPTRGDIVAAQSLDRRGHEALDALLAMVHTLTGPGGAGPGAFPGSGQVTPPRQMVEAARRVLGCEHACLIALDPETERLNPIASAGWPPETERGCSAELRQFHLRDYLSRYPIWRLRAGVVISYNLREAERRGLPTHGLSRLLVVPLRMGTELVGMLALDYGSRTPVTSFTEPAMIEGTADLATLVLQHDRLWRERETARAGELAMEETTRRMDAFLATAIHDIRTPLTTAMGFNALAARAYERLASEVLEIRPDLAAQAERVMARMNDARESEERLSRMVDILFDVAKTRAGKLELRREPCELTATVRKQVEALRVANPTRPLHLEVLTDAPIYVVADADRIAQVIANYVTNAVKYSNDDQPIQVRVAVEGDWARVSVEDHGPGLAPSEQERIWQQFYRVEGISGQNKQDPGLGLGLYICKTIIEGHGGEVGVDSKVGQGSTFWFRLRLADTSGKCT